ncbi:META domain-containing protein [Hydrogenimonas cancrithermarum]|uniref:DUF306 domain-containing protein n=1 Tax=Hydrogenimonas cancrithermarum TaxID=2993563 RepID=A0ABM8FM95_9BACT|nr:META domain-containing protein [Hydrogenimonas cancrithermarum]BDY12634.1 hypothetical protein HCR_09460 [Hydrogenimonas cancrithermarum]
MPKFFVGLGLITIFFLSGCAVDASARPEKACTVKLYGPTWELRLFDNREIFLKHPATIRFYEGDRVGGFGGCNNYFGTVSMTDNAITFSAIGSTRKFCLGEAGEVERMFLGMLKGTKWWHFDEAGNLVIFDDEHRLIFVSKKG